MPEEAGSARVTESPLAVSATTAFWQDLLPEVPPHLATPPFHQAYPVRLPDGRVLLLPLRRLASGDRAVASLIANQASLTVVTALADAMAGLAARLAPDVVVGMPTLGLAFAPIIAAKLGHTRFVPLGYSRKFWYDEALSEPVNSLTSPGEGKRVYLDPNQLALVAGRRVALVDDAVSTGSTARTALRLLVRAGAEVAGIVVAMKQTNRWAATLSTTRGAPPVLGVFGCPMFVARPDGWWPLAETLPAAES